MIVSMFQRISGQRERTDGDKKQWEGGRDVDVGSGKGILKWCKYEVWG